MSTQPIYPRGIIPGAALLAAALLAHAAVADVSLPITAVSFPKEVLPVAAGKIDFWAQLSGFSGTIHVGGGEPHFFQIHDGSSTFQAGFNANDGVANGGLVGVAGFQFHTGTGVFGFWTYEEVFGAGHVGEWHHYVFQWNKDGIPGVNNGLQKVALFVDGVLNSGSWHGVTPGTPGTFVPLTGGTLNLITTAGAPLVSPGNVAIDELKIYDGANNLILWNTLGSAEEIAHSAVGLNGSFNGGGGAHFVPGISGNAVMAMPVAAIGPAPKDSDSDGIPDNKDDCPNSNLSATVVIGGCNSGVPNTLFASGCTISDLIAQCARGASNHDQFVSCVSNFTNALVKAATITGQQKGAIEACAAQAATP